MAIVFGFIVPTIITFQAGVQEKFLRNYINPRTLLEPIIFPVFLFLLISAVAALVYLYRSRHASLPVLLLYLSMFIQSVLLLHLTFFYLMIAVIMTHWLQEIFLIGRIYLQNQEAKAQIKYDLKRKARFIFGATIVVLTVSGFVGWIQHIPTLRQYRITVSGGFNHWPAMTPNLYWIITMAFATIMSFAILHFYIDKLVHRGRDWSRS